jgi:hypothetical protein
MDESKLPELPEDAPYLEMLRAARRAEVEGFAKRHALYCRGADCGFCAAVRAGKLAEDAPTLDLGEYRPGSDPDAVERAELEARFGDRLDKAIAAHPDAVERGVEMPLGFMPNKLENRHTRLAATAQWQPPKVQGQAYWSEELPPEHFEAFALGMIGTSGDGERVRVTRIDRERMRVYFEPVAEKMPTRRELVKQRQKQRRGVIDIEARRLQRKARQ